MDRLTAAANCLKECGAYKIYAVATHGLLSKDACEQLENSALDEVSVVITKGYIQWTLRITDTLVHRLLPFIRGMSFIGVFYLSHLPLHLILIL